ncbi:light-harvesting antenna LH1, alpha subunit [Thiobaca trueperi]|uniref:Light-harvesting protein B-800-850 alpha chain n=1 Tax=Thiobaca trueperi TaxID=127458 RepID=A0A4R3MWY9_9GAMM|nr:light-harvesting antenna LH1, alpha subunit [Thiobaca trueperi]TCT18839.1 light-harvesting protein B-800-850 alpha chain [Thiobaca trueperi]
MEIMGYKPLEQDYRFWMVVNPSTWMVPILIAIAAIAVIIHLYAFSLPGQGFASKAEAPAAPVVEAAPAK